jgi:ubiquitin carboxyl-terminal hydrolase 10
MRRKLMGADSERVELPEQHAPGAETVAQKDESQNSVEVSQHVAGAPAKVEAPAPQLDTSSTQDQLSETAASSTVAASSSAQPPTVTPSAVKPAVPAVPVVPALPKASPKETKATASVEKPTETKPAVATSDEQQAESVNPPAESVDGAAPASQPVPAWTKPKLWTGLFSKPNGAVASSSSAATDAQAETNGHAAEGTAAVPGAGSFAKANASSLAQALQAYRPSAPDRLAFLEPRGLVNTGNMCYMNSVRTSRRPLAGSFLTVL